jgi:hypothetical protein
VSGDRAVARAAEQADRARTFAKQRLLNHISERLHMAPGETMAMHEVVKDLELIEEELANAFIVGWAVRDEETAAGRLPNPRRKR